MSPSKHRDTTRLRALAPVANVTPRLLSAQAVFFPAATAYAVVVAPGSVLAMLGAAAPMQGLLSPIGHAHEMVFGFALAVICGHQLGSMKLLPLMVLLGVWVLARVAFLIAPQSLTSIGANVAYAVMLGWRFVPRLVATTKNLRNAALPGVLTSICASGIAFQALMHTGFDPRIRAVIEVVALLLALLMLFMGGRLLATAVAGQLYRQRVRGAARVQPRSEGALIVSMSLASLAALLPDTPLTFTLEAVAMIVAAILAAVRMVRLRLWSVRGRPDLLCLAVGYGWIALGIGFTATSVLAGRDHVPALHMILVGGLGTLTFNVMTMMHVLKTRTRPFPVRVAVGGTLLISIATVLRLASAVGFGDYRLMLLFASLSWSGAFALLLALQIRR